jgi:hypothetical protein
MIEMYYLWKNGQNSEAYLSYECVCETCCFLVVLLFVCKAITDFGSMQLDNKITKKQLKEALTIDMDRLTGLKSCICSSSFSSLNPFKAIVAFKYIGHSEGIRIGSNPGSIRTKTIQRRRNLRGKVCRNVIYEIK